MQEHARAHLHARTAMLNGQGHTDLLNALFCARAGPAANAVDSCVIHQDIDAGELGRQALGEGGY